MNKKRTAGYVRVSTAQQAETGTSVEDQIEKIKKEAKFRDWQEPKMYLDEGVSGKSTQRPALQQLLKDTAQGQFDVIIFSKLDRLARNLRDTLNIYHETEKHGTAMVCLDNPVISTDGPMGSVMLQIMGAFAQFERDLIRTRTVAGRMSKWKKGEAFMGKLPFGYSFNKATSNIEIDEQKEKIIQKIYSLYLDTRLSMLDVASRLTDDGIPSPSTLAGRKDASSHWNINTVREILINESYTGISTDYNQYQYKWNKNNKIYKSKELKEETDWITFEFPQIIEKNKFDLVQAKIQHNKITPKKKHSGFENKFLAENFLRCGNCKARMSKQSTGTRKYIYYACPWRRVNAKQLKVKNQERCTLPFLNSDKVDAQIFNQVANLITNPKKYAAEWVRNKPIEELTEKVNALSIKQQLLKSKLTKAIQIEVSTDDPELEEIYKKEREKLESEHQSVKRNLTSSQNELLFHTDKIQKLEQFQKIFTYKRGNAMRMKLALKRALNNLSFEDKKKLVEAVISPETGGCVYVRELNEHDIGPLTSYGDESQEEYKEDEKAIEKHDESHEKAFVLELDFTLETQRVIEIIRSISKNIADLGGLLSGDWEIHSHNSGSPP